MVAVIVYELFVEEACRTRVFASQRVVDELADYSRRESHRGFYLRKLKEYAVKGFGPFTGDKRPVRHEWSGVFRIGHDSTLFRVIGFFAGEGQEEFIAIDAFRKRGTELGAAERNRIERAATIKGIGAWRKAVTDGDGA